MHTPYFVLIQNVFVHLAFIQFKSYSGIIFQAKTAAQADCTNELSFI